VKALIADGHAGFCEIMIDNFLHLPVDALRECFEGIDVSFHIMNSRFIQRDAHELELLAQTLKPWIAGLRPIYVSDHLASFFHEGRQLPFPMEVDYDGGYGLIKERFSRWQDLVGAPVLLENYASMLDSGRGQPDFLERLTAETGTGLLFDFSNAVVAWENSGLALERWTPLIAKTRHFHVSGFRRSDGDPVIAIDSHDVDLAPETINFIAQSSAAWAVGAERTLVVERDAPLDVAIPRSNWRDDLGRVREACA
jgi:uncharacterized protein (UPF0276 family)